MLVNLRPQRHTVDEKVAAMKKWAEDNYEKGGDSFVECWGREEYVELLTEEQNSLTKAIARMKFLARLWKEKEQEVKAEVF